MEKIKNVLSSFLNISNEDLKTALDTDNPELLMSGFEGLKQNSKKEGQRIGEKIGREILLKKMSETSGIEISDKSPETFLSSFEQKIKLDYEKSKGITDDEKEKAWKNKYSELENRLKVSQDTIGIKESEIANLNSRISDFSVNDYISGLLPSELPAGINRKEAIQITKMNMPKFNFEGDKYYTEKLNDHGNKISLDDEINSFVKSRGWGVSGNNNQGGRGGNHKTPPMSGIETILSMSDFYTYLEEKNINPDSNQASAELAKAMQNKDFKM